LRFTPEDSLLWFQTWGGPEIEESHGMCIDGDHVFIAGETWSYGWGKNDALLIKATADGQFPATIAGQQSSTAPLPALFRLEQNYPNPCNAATAIEFHLSRGAHVSVQVFDILGRAVTHLVDQELSAGEHRIPLCVAELPSGIYLYRLQAEGLSQTMKLMVLK